MRQIKPTKWQRPLALLAGLSVAAAAYACATPLSVGFSQPEEHIGTYDFIEVTAAISDPTVKNPFTEASLDGTFEKIGSAKWEIHGFADSADGSLFRIRFMPSEAGNYRYTITYQQGALTRMTSGSFQVSQSTRNGPIRVDPKYPWHFLWEGNGKHYFLNGTTAFWLMGWKDNRTIDYSIDRLARLHINRVRVTLAGRECYSFYGDPVMNAKNFSTFLMPWPASDPGDCAHPGFDYSRFNIDYWRRRDEMLRFARERNVIISIVLDMNDSGVHPAAESEDESRFFRYAAYRLGAFSNITWDLGDDLNGYRSDQWAHNMGTKLKRWDAYKHLATSHPRDNSPAHQDRASEWFGFTSYQDWSRGEVLHKIMLTSRQLQEKSGRIVPQTDEEYGYEDHRPFFSTPEADTADALRKTAWAVAMAGAYGDTGESARQGTNVWPDSGGGWVNGRGDDTMTMLLGYEHLVDFFTSFEWWRTNPHDELVDEGNWCLADPGNIYAIYLPTATTTSISLMPGGYTGEWFSPLTGERIALPPITVSKNDGSWLSPEKPGNGDWALLIIRKP